MVRISVFLAVLLVVLTFNAYACILPLQPAGEMDCSSETDEPIRETCDAFLELGPHSSASSSHHVDTTIQFESVEPVDLLPDAFVPLVSITTPPRGAHTPLHFSIHTTVLRI